jgi:hypothetical protein
VRTVFVGAYSRDTVCFFMTVNRSVGLVGVSKLVCVCALFSPIWPIVLTLWSLKLIYIVKTNRLTLFGK